MPSDCQNCNNRPLWINRIVTLLAIVGLLVSVVLIGTVGIPALATGRLNAGVNSAQPISITPESLAQNVPFFDADQAAQMNEILRLVNDARQASGLSALEGNPILEQSALLHSQDQAQRDTMTHDGSDGSNAADRVTRLGYAYQVVGENVLVQQAVNAEQAFDLWWNSPPHHENMMNPDFTQIGIAFTTSASEQVYYTMVLGRPR